MIFFFGVYCNISSIKKRAPVFNPALLTFHPEDIKEKAFVYAHIDYTNEKLGL